jgi:hypothetical protein
VISPKPGDVHINFVTGGAEIPANASCAISALSGFISRPHPLRQGRRPSQRSQPVRIMTRTSVDDLRTGNWKSGPGSKWSHASSGATVLRLQPTQCSSRRIFPDRGASPLASLQIHPLKIFQSFQLMKKPEPFHKYVKGLLDAKTANSRITG